MVSAQDPVFSSGNSSYRYGDGLFETMRVRRGSVWMIDRHFQRLFGGMELLGYTLPAFFNPSLLSKKIQELLEKNNCKQEARVRLSVYRGQGGLYDNDGKTGYLIECWPLDSTTGGWNENGLVIGIFPNAVKVTDRFANLKTASMLPYSLAARYAKEQRWNDALVLNTHGALADSSIANIFVIRQGAILTPSLDQGCVAGTCRAYLLEKLRDHGYPVKESQLMPSVLEEAEEVFLTNAIRGIRWVQSVGNSHYTCKVTQELFERFIKDHRQLN